MCLLWYVILEIYRSFDPTNNYTCYPQRPDQPIQAIWHLTYFSQVFSAWDNPWSSRLVGHPRKSCLGQIDQIHCEELEMDRGSAWQLTMRDPHRWKWWMVGAITPNNFSSHWLTDTETVGLTVTTAINSLWLRFLNNTVDVWYLLRLVISIHMQNSVLVCFSS